MARVKVSEYQAKRWLYGQLSIPYQGWHLTAKSLPSVISQLNPQQKYVVKVDQGVKKRFKQGLIELGIKTSQIATFITRMGERGYSQFLLEPLVDHQANGEKYLALSRVRSGVEILFSDQGGVDVENNWKNINRYQNQFTGANPQLVDFINHLVTLFNRYHLTYLEINPLLWQNNQPQLLDLAVEVDDAALGLSELVASELIPLVDHQKTASELEVAKLDNNTPASLKYRLINPHGRIWMLLSGGGASLVLADEVADAGHGPELANYGEYSGSPTTEDTYLYTRIILGDLLNSRAGHKVLIIAGGVANFTDVAKTFQGIIRALKEKASDLKEQRVKVFVRRGGPNEQRGLALMENFLQEQGLLGVVLGSNDQLTTVVNLALQV